jgi:hypothetical protein
MADILLDLGVRDARQSTPYPVYDLEPGLALGDHAPELVSTNDADHRDTGLFHEHSEAPTLDVLHDLPKLGPDLKGRESPGLQRASHGVLLRP